MALSDIRQSSQYAQFMTDIGWQVEKIGNSQVFLRKFPLIGYFGKIPKINPPLPYKEIEALRKKYRIFALKIAPFIELEHHLYNMTVEGLIKHSFIPDTSPFNPTTTIQIDLTRSKKDIFNSFTQAKRRAVRKAQKNGIYVIESANIADFIYIRKQQYYPYTFLIDSETEKIWKCYAPKHASLLLAYSPIIKKRFWVQKQYSTVPVAGILLLFYQNVAYYWFASSLKIGKKLFAPSLLVWEACKIAKRRKARLLDFEGIYDARFPKAAASWKGFTKFKEGFGGKTVTLAANYKLKNYISL